MATTTQNYNLTKPGTEDIVDIEVLNDNFDKIDEQMKNNEDRLPPVATTDEAGIVKPDGTTVTVDEDGTLRGAQTYVLPPATKNNLGGVKQGVNVVIAKDGTISAYAEVDTDPTPTENSKKAVSSDGVYNAIGIMNNRVEVLESSVNAITTGIIWKEAVDTYSDLNDLSPEVNWTVMCRDTNIVYNWDGERWNEILAVIAPTASASEVKAVLEGDI